MTPYSRFTLFHSSLDPAGVVVENPVGWDDAVVSLERSEWHSLVEYYKGNFMWYGTAMETLKTIEASFGPNAVVELNIDLSFKTGVYVNLFTGQIKLSELEEHIIADRIQYQMTAPIVRDDFWSKFVNRMDSQVDLQGTIDLDGNARTAVNKIVLPMPSQKIRVNGEYQQSIPILIGTLYDYTFSDPDPQYDMEDDDYAQVDFDTVVLDEAKQKHTLVTNPTGSIIPINIFTALHDGVYTFESMLTFMRGYNLSIPSGTAPNDPTDVLRDTDASGTRLIRAYFQKNSEAPIEFTIADTAVFIFTKISGFTTYTANETFTLLAGDKVTLFLQSGGNWYYQNNGINRSFEQLYMIGRNTEELQLSGGGFGGWTDGGDKVDLVSFVANYEPESYLKITADTTYVQTETDAYLIKDAAASIISKIVGQDNALKSDYLDTCKGRNAIFRIKHLRGWTFANKQMSMSMSDWWKGGDPLLFLGMGYTEVAGVKKIEIEERAYFYDSTPVVNISNVNKLIRRYDLEKFYKQIEVRFKKGVGSESAGGMDDPQSSRVWTNDFGSMGKDEKIVCEWMAASLALERLRRNRVEISQDDKDDEEIGVVAVVEDGDDWLPEFGTAFAAITNLLNSDFRINVRHSATRLFNRAISWFNGCMIYSTTGVFAFNRGEGNYEMTSQLESDDCESTGGTQPVVDESADIPATDAILFVPRIYEIETVPMAFTTYQTIVANKNKALGVSRTDSDHVAMHIMNLDYTIFRSEGKLLLLQATEEGL